MSLVGFDTQGQASEPILYNIVNNRYVVPAMLSTLLPDAASHLDIDHRIFVDLYFTEPDAEGKEALIRDLTAKYPEAEGMIREMVETFKTGEREE